MQKKAMDELNRLTLDEFKSQEKWPFVVVLDNVRSIYNVGSIMRTCDAFLCDKLYLCGITVQPPHKELSKTAIGAEKSVDWVYFKQTTDAVTELKNQGYYIVGIEQTKLSISLEKLAYPQQQKIAFVLGNEVDGVSEEVLQLCDIHCEIPQFGSKHSFNVSVTCGMILWEFAQKFKLKNRALTSILLLLLSMFLFACNNQNPTSNSAQNHSDSISAVQQLKSEIADTQKIAKIYITFSSECPICKLHSSNLQDLVNELNITENLHKKPLLKIINPGLKSKPYPWLAAYSVNDSNLWISRYLNAKVYPEMIVFDQYGLEIYRGKLSNRATAVGEMSMVKTQKDSSYLNLIANAILLNQSAKLLLPVKSNIPVGCFIEY